MCGIAGLIVRSQAISADEARGAVRRLTESLRHRGPDDSGFYEDVGAGVFLGHRRLSIVDLSAAGRQPMLNAAGTVALSYNGEIYNHPSLREQLAPSDRFVSTTDTEVLLHAYDRWGLDFLGRLEGMFAFALHDQTLGKVWLVRDPLGIKPLYYIENPKWIAFASEARSLMRLGLPGWTPDIDMQAADRLLGAMYLAQEPDTLIAGVRRLPPGHLAEIDRDGLRIRPHWQLRHRPGMERISPSDAIEQTRTLLEQVVREHLVADVDVGVMLSGGLDSSLIAALAQKNAPQPLRTFTAGFPHALDERPYAKAVAEHIGSRHEEVLIDPAEAGKRLLEILPTFDDLGTVDGGIIMISLVAEKIREHGIKVLLVGEGADEVFAGYSWFGVSQYPFRALPRLGRAALCQYATTRVFHEFLGNSRRITRVFRESGASDPLRQIQYWELRTQLPNHYLMKVDKATMAHSIEARVPYLDRRLVQWAFDLPSRLLLPGQWWTADPQRPKAMLRHIARTELPPAIFSRPKRGFSLPMHDFLQANRELVRDCLLDPSGLPARLLPKRHRQRLLDYRYSGYHPVYKQREWMTWKLFLMELWRRTVMQPAHP